MKMRWWLSVLTLLIGLTLLPSLAAAQVTAPPQQYAFQVQAVGENPVYETITTGRCRVLTAGTFNTDAPTIYTDANLSTAATVLTAAGWAPTIALDSSGTCKWFAATGTNTFDVIVYIDSGAYAGLRMRVDGVSRTGLKQARFDRSTPVRVLSIPFLKNTSTQTSTTKLPAGASLIGAEVEVVIAVASSTVSFGAATPLVGTSLCNAQQTITAGFWNCNASPGVDTGTAAIALTYITSNHNIAGFLNVSYLQHGGN